MKDMKSQNTAACGLLKEPFYPQVTIRNGNTFDRLAELLEQDEVQG